MENNLNYRKSRSSCLKISAKSNITPISDRIYVNTIITNNNITNNLKSKQFSFKNYLSHRAFNSKNLNKFLLKLKYILKPLSKYKSLNYANDNNYLYLFLHILLLIYEIEDYKIDHQKEEIINYFLLFLKKLYLLKKIEENEIIIILKFAVFSSIYERKEIGAESIDKLKQLNDGIFKNSSGIKSAIDILKIINNSNITNQFCEFLINNIVSVKPNLFFLSSQFDLLELLYLTEVRNLSKSPVIELITKIFSFRYDKSFLNIFIEKIKIAQTNPNNLEKKELLLQLLNNIYKSIFIIKKINTFEDNIYNNDPNLLTRGFIFNNNIYNGIYSEKIIVQEALTLIFSFCFSPTKNSTPEGKTNKNNSQNIYPIINFRDSDNNDFGFFIKGNILYHKIFKDKVISIGTIKENFTYICYYSIKEHDNYIISVKSEIDNFELKADYKHFLKRNFNLFLGKYEKKNFEGYIGPVILFGDYFNDKCKNYIFSLKGHYSKILFYHDYDTNQLDKYDKFVNHVLSDNNLFSQSNDNNNLIIKDIQKKQIKQNAFNKFMKRNTAVMDPNAVEEKLNNTEGNLNNSDYYINLVKEFKENININKNLIGLIIPLKKKIKKDIKDVSFLNNNIFIETTIKFFKEPKLENNATLLFVNKSTMFEFLKFEGFNYLTMILEIIISGTWSNINYNNEINKLIIEIFGDMMNLVLEILDEINTEFYLVEIRNLLFAIKKFVLHFGQRNKEISSQILYILFNFINYFENYTNNNVIKKYNFIDKKKNTLVLIRDEICKFILNPFLYKISDSKYTIGEINLLQNLINIISKIEINSENNKSLNIYIFKKLMKFSQIFNIYSQSRDDEKIKTLKTKYTELLVKRLSNSENLDLLLELYKNISANLDCDYEKYKFLKIFYLVSNIYFSNIKNDILITSLKYFIDLFCSLINEEKNSNNNIIKTDEKEKNSIIGISLRLILENIKLLATYNKMNSNKTFDIIKYFNEKMILQEDNKDHTTEEQKTTENKRSNSISSNMSIQLNLNNDNINLKSENRKNSKSPNKSREININITNIKDDKQNNNNSNINKLSENYIYQKIFEKLSTSLNLNDFIFKSLLLLLLEKNNKIILPQYIRYNFILKTKEYSQLDNLDFKSVLILKNCKKEIETPFIQLIGIIKRNKNNITTICYDILLYILMKALQDRSNKNVYCLFVENTHIFPNLFKYAFLNNQLAANNILDLIPEMCRLIIPYHNRYNIITYILYLTLNDSRNLTIFFNKIMNFVLTTKMESDNPKVIYDFLINKLIIVHDIVCSYDNNDKINSNFIFNCEGLSNLICNDLINTKIAFVNSNSLNHKKKCYINLLYELFFTIYIKTKNIIYLKLINTVFIDNIKNYKKKCNCKTVLFHIDRLNLSVDKKNPCLKLYSKLDKIEEESICILLLKNSLDYWKKYKDESPQIAEILDKYVNYFSNDAKLIFKENKIFQKKTKDNTWYNFLIDKLTEAINKKQELNIKDIQSKILDKQNSQNKSGEKLERNNSKNDNEEFNSSINFSFNINTEEKNEYFLDTQDSTKLQTEENDINYSNTINVEQELIQEKNINKNKKLENIDKKTSRILAKKSATTTNLLKPRNQEFQYLSIRQVKKNIDNRKNSINLKEFDFDLENINFYEKVTLFPKRIFLQQNFACYFTDFLFMDKFFIKIIQYYKYYVKKLNPYYEIDTSNYFNYPIILKNYLPHCFYFGDFFVKHDINFFSSNFLTVSHSYCIDKIKEYNEKYLNKIINIFPKITEVDNLNNLLINDSNKNDFTVFYVDLVTNRNVIFGNLKINENILYFENMNKEKFINNLNDNEKINYLLCSLNCDYSNRKKKLYIFKNEIKEIIIRRFLYQFQACEIYLKNGKSYFFNFYTLENKNKFLSLFFPKNYTTYKSNITITSPNVNIEIICDLKSYFKKKNYTKKWISNEISTIEYLLYINKFSSRSYNDINQYPIFPWLDLYDGSMRNLKYTVAAQDEEDRNELAEIYENSSETFPYHYTTHYSNSAFIIFYLQRLNPYTDNQITLQVDKFDNPERQFNSITGVQNILHDSRQPRELIPEFFINTEFFYNYNCNFFGVRTSDDELIDKLTNKIGYNSPLDYILSNVILLESPIIKTDLHYFIDNIFGVNQKGGLEGYNTYEKYCYQEKVDLRKKIIKFKNEGLTYEEIKDKIESKSNKILSFGQTPFKLFDSSHPQWQQNRSIFKDNSNNKNSLKNSGRMSFVPRASLISNNLNLNLNLLINNSEFVDNSNDNKEKILEVENSKENSIENGDDLNNIFDDINNDNVENNNNMEDEEKNIMGINLQADIIFFGVCDISKYIYILIKKSKRNYDLKFFDLKFNKISSLPTINIAKELKFFSKLKIFNSKFLFTYKYNPKYIFLNFKLSLFLFCHLRDNSFIIYDRKGASKYYLTESLVTCLTKINEDSFLSGHLSGKIIQWKFISPKNSDNNIIFNSNLNEIKIVSVRNIIAHKNHVINIIYCKDIDVIISSGEDKKIFIRKYYDFSLLTMINFENKLCIDIKLNHYFLNILFFDEEEQKNIIEIYSLNGLIVAKSNYELINNFDFDSEGNVFVGYYKSNVIDVYDPSLSVVKNQIVLKIGEKSKIIGGGSSKKKIKVSGDIIVDDQNLFTSFCYNKLNNSIYCSFSNGILFRKKISSN